MVVTATRDVVFIKHDAALCCDYLAIDSLIIRLIAAGLTVDLSLNKGV